METILELRVVEIVPPSKRFIANRRSWLEFFFRIGIFLS